MRSKLLHEVDGLRTFVVVMDKGDEAAAELATFAREQEITGAGLTAVGAASEGTLGYFDPQEKAYQDIPLVRQAEVLSFVGDIAVRGTSPALHAHAVFGLRDGSTIGGHVRRLSVWPTLEVIVTETPTHLTKRVDEETGLALIRPDAE
ncbi:hypothetical protein FHX42_003520 [Saccharopolyspora lacisalsi]|uniref:PPC domain-containing protein n=1 Tax=Halosaccharopolyspora lacisalsi TaxID=1000566 RepID=A0A839DXB5_9PSEU|nr:PPC domain-containing DNA-binding protein [Halosaccharopolyspora lacisalsi]MBA8826144.1 hypothetical protein [Halosaccharopolyspora lacisalsi]